MRANEVGVKSPESNTREIITEHHDEKFFRNIISIGDDSLVISIPNIIEFQRETITILKQINIDWGITGLDIAGINNAYNLGLSFLTEQEALDGSTRDNLVNRSFWMSYMSVIVMSGVGAVLTAEHEDEEMFASILRDQTTDNYDGVYLWSHFSKSEGKIELAGRLEYDVKYIQRTFSEEYTHLGERYSHGWDDSEFEESFIEDDE